MKIYIPYFRPNGNPEWRVREVETEEAEYSDGGWFPSNVYYKGVNYSGSHLFRTEFAALEWIRNRFYDKNIVKPEECIWKHKH